MYYFLQLNTDPFIGQRGDCKKRKQRRDFPYGAFATPTASSKKTSSPPPLKCLYCSRKFSRNTLERNDRRRDDDRGRGGLDYKR